MKLQDHSTEERGLPHPICIAVYMITPTVLLYILVLLYTHMFGLGMT